MRVLIKSPFSIYSGYGQDGWSLARALMKWGCDVFIQPVWIDIPVPKDLLHLLLKPLDPPFDLTINHWDPSNIQISEPARQCTRFALAWTMWEFSGSPDNPNSGLNYFKAGQHTLRDRLKWYDLVLGYDPVTIAAIKPFIPDHVNYGVLQGGFEAGNWRPMERDWHGDRLGFFMHGHLNNRKVPFLAVEAFNQLKMEHGEDFAGATLSLHTSAPGLFTEMNKILEERKIRIFFEVFSDEVLHQFYQANHVLLAPSRGEGKDLPALEFMSTGGAVIASNYGGHTMWMNEEFAYPLDYKMMPTFEGKPDGPWDARVSLESLKEAIWHVWLNRAEAKQKGAIAAKTIPSMCDWSVVVEDMFRRIRDLCPANGELIYNMAQACRRKDTDVKEHGAWSTVQGSRTWNAAG